MKIQKARKPSKAEFDRINAIKDEDIDCSDIPEMDFTKDTFFDIIRPVDFLEDHEVPKKVTVDIRLDSDVVSFFQRQSSRYQTSINKVLRGYMLSKKVRK